MRAGLLLFVAAILSGCFLAPRPASERPLSYHTPVPGWVRHDVDSTLSLLLPPELQRQPRADTAFAPVFFLSDSARVTVRFGADAGRALPEVGALAVRSPYFDLRNGNHASFLPFQSDRFDLGTAAFYSSCTTRPEGFPFSSSPSPDQAAAGTRCGRPGVLVELEWKGRETGRSVDALWDFIQVRGGTSPLDQKTQWWEPASR